MFPGANPLEESHVCRTDGIDAGIPAFRARRRLVFDQRNEQWDEIIELEIQLAPGNRASSSDLGSAQNLGGGQNKPPGQPKKHRPRTISNNRRPRPNKPTGSQV